MESSVNTLLQTLKDNLNSDELVGLDKENYPCLYPESKQAKNNKGNRCWECMPCCYWGLFIFFNQRCIDALVKSTRQSLDAIKRRMQAASKHSKESLDADNKSPALFKVSTYSTRRALAPVPGQYNQLGHGRHFQGPYYIACTLPHPSYPCAFSGRHTTS